MKLHVPVQYFKTYDVDPRTVSLKRVMKHGMPQSPVSTLEEMASGLKYSIRACRLDPDYRDDIEDWQILLERVRKLIGQEA